MSRLSSLFSSMQATGHKAMGLFVTNGFPTLHDTPKILSELDKGGADFIELGMPFSDPLAEGLPIQRSSARALAGGTTMKDAFASVASFRKNSTTPVLLMGYINPILQFGVEEFCTEARRSGVDGLIIPDLPPQEASILTAACQKAALDLVFLVAPNSPDERIQFIDQLSSGFVYAVSVTGLTGSGIDQQLETIEDYLKRVRGLVLNNPLLVGFGIKTHHDARRFCRYTDGFVVGSALVDLIEQVWDDPSLSPSQRLEQVRRFAYTLKHGHNANN